MVKRKIKHVRNTFLSLPTIPPMFGRLIAAYLSREIKTRAYGAAVDAVAAQMSDSAGKTRPGGEKPGPCDVVILLALSAEASPLIERLTDAVSIGGSGIHEHQGSLAGKAVSVVVGGVGQTAAAAAARQMVAERNPVWLICAGFAGGLVDGLRKGHILLADKVVCPAQPPLSPDLMIDRSSVASQSTLHLGTLLTVDRLIAAPHEKRSLGEVHGAAACDMESYAVLRVSRQHHEDANAIAPARQPTPRVLSVRIISDTVNERLPPDVETLLHQESNTARLGAAAAALLHRPSAAKDLWRLKEESGKLAERLAKFLEGTVRNLP